MIITLHGAAGEVTGSVDLLETDRARVLVDCGRFQGKPPLEPLYYGVTLKSADRGA